MITNNRIKNHKNKKLIHNILKSLTLKTNQRNKKRRTIKKIRKVNQMKI